MRKLLLVVGILCIAVCVAALLLAAFHLIGYTQGMDGSAELYARLHRRMVGFCVLGVIFAAVGTVCLVLRGKL